MAAGDFGACEVDTQKSPLGQVGKDRMGFGGSTVEVEVEVEVGVEVEVEVEVEVDVGSPAGFLSHPLAATHGKKIPMLER